MKTALMLISNNNDYRAVVPAGGTLLIGRGMKAGLQLDDDSVAERHARVFHAEDVWHVEDVGGAGTFKNGDPVTASAPITEGDVIGLGNVRLYVVFTDDAFQNDKTVVNARPLK